MDSMVVETNIHHPTDSALLGDGVRVLSRLDKESEEGAAGRGCWSPGQGGFSHSQSQRAARKPAAAQDRS